MSKSIAQVADLIDDTEVIAKYEKYQLNGWPEVREKQKAIGIERMEIFRSGNHLFMYITAPDDFNFDADFTRFKPTPRNRYWQDIMSTLLQKVTEANDGELWRRIPTVSDSEWSE